MYIVITEDGEAFTYEKLQDGDLGAAEDGLIDLLDITDPQEPLRYGMSGEWVEIEESI